MSTALAYPKDAPTQAMPLVRPSLAEELFSLGAGRHARRVRSHRAAQIALLVGAMPFALAAGLIVVAMTVAVFPGLLLVGS